MIVHFVGPTYNLEKNIETYRKIIQVIHEEGHVLARDWVEMVYREKKSGRYTQPNWRVMSEELVEATERADMVIVDASGRSTFGVGFQGAIALEKKKPSLWLRARNSIQGAFVSAYEHELLLRADFSENSVAEVVKDFLKKNTVLKKDLTFNFAADRQIFNYLKASALQGGKTKAEVLRDIILEDMNNSQ